MNVVIELDDKNTKYTLQLLSYLNRAYLLFLEKAHTDNHYKAIEILKDIPFTFSVSTRYKDVYGMAFADIRKKKVHSVQITMSHNILRCTEKRIYDGISHELAHCIEYCYKGTSSHNKEWKELHKLIGGTGDRLI